MPGQRKPRTVLGLMVLGPPGSPGARMTSMNDFRVALDMFQERGHTELDTARAYINGLQESFTREAGWKERGLAIATKVYPIQPGTHEPETLAKSIETSLREYGTDCIDIFYLHAPDCSIPFSSTLAALDALHKAGRFKRLGLSNYASFEVAEIVMLCVHNDWVRPSIYKGIYNVLFRAIEPELVPTCRRYGIAIEIYSPMGGGFLAGRFASKDEVPREGRYARGSPVEHLTRGRYFRDGMIEGARMIREACEVRGLEPLEVAVRWIVHHSVLKLGEDGGGSGDGIVIGFSNLKQLRDSLDYVGQAPLPDDLIAVLDQAWRTAKTDVDTYWQMPMQYTYDTQEFLFGPASITIVKGGFQEEGK